MTVWNDTCECECVYRVCAYCLASCSFALKARVRGRRLLATRLVSCATWSTRSRNSSGSGPVLRNGRLFAAHFTFHIQALKQHPIHAAHSNNQRLPRPPYQWHCPLLSGQFSLPLPCIANTALASPATATTATSANSRHLTPRLPSLAWPSGMSSSPTSPLSLSSSCSAHTVTASDTSFVTLFHIVPVSVICGFLSIEDVLTVASVDCATRRLLFSSPAVRRTRVFTSSRCLPGLPTVSSHSSSPPPQLSSCDVVQLVEAKGFWPDPMPADWPLTLASLLRYPNLRRLHAEDSLFARLGDRRQQQQQQQHPSPSALSPSLSSMRHLTRLSLFIPYGDPLRVEDMRLLATLPVLASFEARHTKFARGNRTTQQQWQALTASQQPRRATRKAEQLGSREADKEDDERQHEEEEEEGEQEENKAQQRQHEDDDSEEEADVYGDYEPWELPHDPSLPRKYSALLLFLHTLATKPSLVHLVLDSCRITPFVLDHMPVWPQLLSLSLLWNSQLSVYDFETAATRFPSLTSLTSPNCSDAAIAHLVRLPALEELRFPHYQTTDPLGVHVQTSARGFLSFSEATKLRSIYYSPPERDSKKLPRVTAFPSPVSALTHLTRLTIPATWPVDELLSKHRFEHLRCLALLEQWSRGFRCPQTDALLMPLVKPLDVVVAGREQRQAARLARRRAAGKAEEYKREVEGEKEAERADPVIPADNASNFPSLECLDLPYGRYILCRGSPHCGDVGAWMMAQLRRSYEYEIAEEWKAEMTTLGRAELLKSIMA